MLRFRDMDLRVFQATDKELHEPCGAHSDGIGLGQWVVTCPRCLTLTHVDCWNEQARCPTPGCPTQGRAVAALTQLACKGCPYCGESLPDSSLPRCPHCKEYLNQVLLRQSLELERYNRCPRGIKALSFWYRFNSAMFWLMAAASLGSIPSGSLLLSVFLAALGAGFWKLAGGVREGRSWARSGSFMVSVLYILSLNGLIIGLICLSTLTSRDAQIYFQAEQGDTA